MPVAAVFGSPVLPLRGRPGHHMRYPHRDLVITPGAAIYLDRARCGDAPHLVIQTVGPLFHLMPAERQRNGTIGGGAARRMSAAHAVIL